MTEENGACKFIDYDCQTGVAWTDPSCQWRCQIWFRFWDFCGSPNRWPLTIDSWLMDTDFAKFCSHLTNEIVKHWYKYVKIDVSHLSDGVKSAIGLWDVWAGQIAINWQMECPCRLARCGNSTLPASDGRKPCQFRQCATSASYSDLQPIRKTWWTLVDVKGNVGSGWVMQNAVPLNVS